MAITKVDLRGLEPGKTGWDEARDAVTASMVACGCVVVQHAGLDRDIRQALFSRAMPELFAFPAETKRRNVYDDVQYGGYIGQLPGLASYEGMSIEDVTDAGLISDFANLFWPQGNPAFCETSAGFATNAIKLEQTVTQMVLEGLGVRNKHALALRRDQLRYSTLRMSYYGTSPEEDDSTKVSMPEHRDYAMTTVIIQHEVEGLEVQLKDGGWFAVPPEPATCAIVAGSLFTVVTNGRVQACFHRSVKTRTNRERFSALVGCMPTQGSTVQAMEDLVDEGHPLMYHPCDPYKCVSFQYSEEGRRSKDALKAFCGVLPPFLKGVVRNENTDFLQLVWHTRPVSGHPFL